ncbi:MAG: hypothetical protein M1827_003029 [Pycnora praestabilis]|nr:MAG: hypothetical protein M1827_003029 [Pycnora praestabilis]
MDEIEVMYRLDSQSKWIVPAKSEPLLVEKTQQPLVEVVKSLSGFTQEKTPVCFPSLGVSPNAWFFDGTSRDTSPGVAESPVRGSTREVQVKCFGLSSQISGSRRSEASSIEMTAESVRCRSTSRGFFEKPEDSYESTILEPCPIPTVNRSMSDVIARLASASSLDDIAGSRTNSPPTAPLDLRKFRGFLIEAPHLPFPVMARILHHVDHAEYLSLRLTCRAWSASVTFISPPNLPAAFFLPTEILQHIYRYLPPVDFNASRHTCRSWMLASLDKSLLGLMLKRGGWWSGIQQDLQPLTQRDEAPDLILSETWLMSKRLARECSLGPGWSGNGLQCFRVSLDRSEVGSVPASPGHLSDLERSTSLVKTSATDFTEIGSAGLRVSPRSSFKPIVSICGKFLMVTERCMVSIFQLRDHERQNSYRASYGGFMAPVTSILCPRKVLSASMDTSSERFAVAILMEGRMGLVYDLQDQACSRSQGATRALRRGQVGQGLKYLGQLTLATVDLSGTGFAHHQAISEPAVAASGSRGCWSRSSDCSRQTWTPNGTSQANPRSRSSGQSWIEVGCGPRSIYRNLCSEDDPPRSIAICPQRRCVAFGCSAGIELHWVDALTGQDLNRWFPLTAPSDYLYFLASRSGVDLVAKKLRLISSAAPPNERPPLSNRHSAVRPVRTASSLPTLVSSLTFDSSTCISTIRDHYRAVPISDGYHVLFVDPATKVLCFGSDSPCGGSTKLLRKIMLIGPEDLIPTVYASGGELKWGIRVVAGYGDRVFLFSIPPDNLNDSKTEQSYHFPAPLSSCGPISSLSDKVSWRQDGSLEEEDWHSLPRKCSWPVRIKGTEIGSVRDLSDVAVDSGPDLTVWTFGADGMAYTWQVDTGRNMKVRRRKVLRDGTIVDEIDADGDVRMSEAPRLAEDGPQDDHEFHLSLDGALLFTPAATDVFAMAEDLIDGAVAEATDQDVEMPDAEVVDDSSRDHGGWEEGWAPCAGHRVAYEPSRSLENSTEYVIGWARDHPGDDSFLDVMGITRLECNIS